MIAEYMEDVYSVSVQGKEAVLLTYNQGKSINGFEPKRDYFKKTVNIGNPDLVSIYNLHFYVKYKDCIEEAEMWLVDEGRAVGLKGSIENNEVIIDVSHDAKDESWIQYDKGVASKKIDVNDCTEYLVEKRYIKQNGRLVNGITERTSVSLNTFKKSIVMNRKKNL